MHQQYVCTPYYCPLANSPINLHIVSHCTLFIVHSYTVQKYILLNCHVAALQLLSQSAIVQWRHPQLVSFTIDIPTPLSTHLHCTAIGCTIAACCCCCCWAAAHQRTTLIRPGPRLPNVLPHQAHCTTLVVMKTAVLMLFCPFQQCSCLVVWCDLLSTIGCTYTGWLRYGAVRRDCLVVH